MAKKKREHKPKLRLVKNDPEDPTIEDIEHAVDETILRGDILTDQDIADAFIRQEMSSEVCLPKLEFELVVNANSELSILDVISAEKIMVHCPNLDDEDFVWVLFLCYNKEQLGNQFDLTSVHTKQVRAINRCLREIDCLLHSSPEAKNVEICIYISKYYDEVDENVRENINIHFFIPQYMTKYILCSQRLLGEYIEDGASDIV